MEIIDSIALVERRVRASVGGTSRRSTVRVSVRPSRRLPAALGWVLSSSRASALRGGGFSPVPGPAGGGWLGGGGGGGGGGPCRIFVPPGPRSRWGRRSAT